MTLLIADVGGTNVRFAVADEAHAPARDHQVLECARFAGIGVAVQTYLDQVDAPVDSMAIALAGPVSDDEIDVTNNHWRFSKQQLLSELEIERLLVVNDFAAQSLAQQEPESNGNLLLYEGKSNPHAPLLVAGPGTGLGLSALIQSGGVAIPIQGEGGHASFAPQSGDEDALLGFLRQRYEHVSIEHIVSGGGLENVYAFLCTHTDDESQLLSAAQIGAAAIAGEGIARDSVMLMLACLGGAVADATLTIGAWRGVVISGGIVPQLRTLVAQSSFAARFYQKGQMQALLSQVPVWLSVDPFAGLRGAQLAFSNPHMADAITSDGTVRPNQLEPGREAS